MEKLKKRQQEVVGGMRSESEGEGKGGCEGNASAADRGALRLHAPVKIRWNSVFDCISKALQLKDAITRFSGNDMELDGRIDGEDDENTSDGEVGRVIEEIVYITHFHSLLFLYIYIFPSQRPPPPCWGEESCSLKHLFEVAIASFWVLFSATGR